MNGKRPPTIETERLVLRPFTLEDAPDVNRLAGDREIASTLNYLPHPFEDDTAVDWIRTRLEWQARGEADCFAITDRAQGFLIGAIDLMLTREHEKAEVGYWIGREYWSQGYCTEAAAAVVDFGFRQLGLNRIWASHMSRNPASSRVLQKIGMKHEGRFRQHVKKWGVFEDYEYYGMLKEDFEKITG